MHAQLLPCPFKYKGSKSTDSKWEWTLHVVSTEQVIAMFGNSKQRIGKIHFHMHHVINGKPHPHPHFAL